MGSGDPADGCGGMAAGLAPMRRMTAVQYANTVDDLFDGLVVAGTQFPPSQIHHEYTNNPTANVVSLAAAEDIMLAAETAAEQVVDNVDMVVDCGGMAEAACADAYVADFAQRAHVDVKWLPRAVLAVAVVGTIVAGIAVSGWLAAGIIVAIWVAALIVSYGF